MALGTALVLALACTGPSANDDAVCRDMIHRLCFLPLCSDVTTRLNLPTTDSSDDCEATLLQRTGCGNDAFTFTTPTRSRVLNCRVTLLREGDDIDTAPTCDDDFDFFTNCSDLTDFLNGDGGTP